MNSISVADISVTSCQFARPRSVLGSDAADRPNKMQARLPDGAHMKTHFLDLPAGISPSSPFK